MILAYLVAGMFTWGGIGLALSAYMHAGKLAAKHRERAKFEAQYTHYREPKPVTVKTSTGEIIGTMFVWPAIVVGYIGVVCWEHFEQALRNAHEQIATVAFTAMLEQLPTLTATAPEPETEYQPSWETHVAHQARAMALVPYRVRHR